MTSDHAVDAWIALLRAHRTALSLVESRLKAAGLPSLAWYDVLLELERADRPLRPFEIEERLLLPQPTVSRLLDRIEEAGYLQRQTCPIDGRGTFLQITPEGRATRRKVWSVYAAAIDEAVGRKLSRGEARSAARLLAKLTG